MGALRQGKFERILACEPGPRRADRVGVDCTRRVPEPLAEEGTMAFVEWEMQGVEFANCNCHTGCPCQFNALPDKGHCRAHTFVQVEKGHFGEVPLDGLRWGIMAYWPGPIHLGG